MAKAGPDTDSSDAQGGYTSDDSASKSLICAVLFHML